MASDNRIVGEGGSQGADIIAVHVRRLLRANALVVVQVNASGDIVNPGAGGGGGGDGTIIDGVDANIKATVKDYVAAKPLAVALVNVSGDVTSPQEPTSKTGSYGRVNVGTGATQILASNPARISAMIQNLEGQQMAVGFDSSMSVFTAGAMLAPTADSSGDGGVFSVSRYKGPLFACVATGDADVFYAEV